MSEGHRETGNVLFRPSPLGNGVGSFSGNLCVRHYSKCFTRFTLFKPHNCSCIEEEAGTEKLVTSPRLHSYSIAELRFKTKWSIFIEYNCHKWYILFYSPSVNAFCYL